MQSCSLRGRYLVSQQLGDYDPCVTHTHVRSLVLSDQYPHVISHQYKESQGSCETNILCHFHAIVIPSSVVFTLPQVWGASESE